MPFVTLALEPSLTTTPLTMFVILSPSQTTSTTILIFVGLYLVLVLESTGMRTSARRARAIPALCIALAAAYVAIISFPPARSYFALTGPSALPVIVSVIQPPMEFPITVTS